MPSIRDQLLAQVVGILTSAAQGPTAQPAGLTVGRFTTLPTPSDASPVIGVYPMPESTRNAFQQQRSPLVVHDLQIRLELRAVAADDETPDQAIDPLYCWAIQQLKADEWLTSSGVKLADYVNETGMAWDADPKDKTYAMGSLDVVVTYHTVAMDPTSRPN